MLCDISFPSPYGELHFSIGTPSRLQECWSAVSVPLRGTTFLNVMKKIDDAIEKVSVPLRGTTFLNRQIHTFRDRSRFRPLTGNYISQSSYFQCHTHRIHVSVPYGELHFSIQRCFCKDELQEFPSPYGELHFSMILWWNNHLSDIVSVPLRGTTFLNKISGLHPHRRHVVSVPLRGTTFLN